MVTYKKKYSSKNKRKLSKKSSRKLSKKSSKKLSKKSSNKNSLKKGGTVLGKGSYGCVISPNLECDDFKVVNGDMYVSKLSKPREYIKDDYDIVEALNIKNLPGYYNHLLVPVTKCRYDETKIKSIIGTDKDVSECIINKSIDESSFDNIIQYKGDITFYKYRDQNPTSLFTDMLPIYMALFDTIKFLNNNGIMHRDLKNDNILIDTTNKRVKLIDFGFAAPISEKLYSSYGNYDVGYADYYIISRDQLERGFFSWPIEMAIFRNWNKGTDPPNYNLTNLDYQIIDNYYKEYEKVWYKPRFIGINDDEDIRLMFDVFMNEGIDKINIEVDAINKLSQNDKAKSIEKLNIECNKKFDVFQLGIILLNDLLYMRYIEIKYTELIDELIKYIFENMLTVYSFDRKNINDAYSDFVGICMNYDINDTTLINSIKSSNFIPPANLPLPPGYFNKYSTNTNNVVNNTTSLKRTKTDYRGINTNIIEKLQQMRQRLQQRPQESPIIEQGKLKRTKTMGI
jgi:serine/threonine protein kinase